MKIGTPELKVKPATKYFAGGYISFRTLNKELFFAIHAVGRAYEGEIIKGSVKSTEQLDQLMEIKKPIDCMRFLQ